jgi:hypothetical protein
LMKIVSLSPGSFFKINSQKKFYFHHFPVTQFERGC